VIYATAITSVVLCVAFIYSTNGWLRIKRGLDESRNEYAKMYKMRENAEARVVERDKRIDELEYLVQSGASRSGDYEAIIQEMLDGFRRASDEYTKARRQKR
jgi:hypothetical protein